MAKIRMNHPGGRGHTDFEVGPDGHEVVMQHPIRTQLGSSVWRNRFTPAEARAMAELLAISADEAEAHPPEAIRD